MEDSVQSKMHQHFSYFLSAPDKLPYIKKILLMKKKKINKIITKENNDEKKRHMEISCT